MDILERFYCTCPIADIATKDYSGDIKDCGSEIIFRYEPKINVRRLVKNQQLDYETFDVCSTNMVIDQAFYFGFKVDDMDLDRVCGLQKMVDKVKMRVSEQLQLEVTKQILSTLYQSVAATNKGANALGGYNLGTWGAPLAITSTNILQVMTYLRAVMRKNCAPMEKPFIILPIEAEPVFMNSELRLAYMSGMNQSTLLGCKVPNVACFDIYFCNEVPYVIDAGRKAFYITAGWSGATAFAGVLKDSQVITQNVNDFGVYYRGRMVWGHKTLRPEALVGLYATFQ